MNILKKTVAMLIVAVMLMSVMGISAFAATPCYLFEDFEANDFVNAEESTTPPTHSGGSNETWMVSAGIDATTAIITESNGDSYLQYCSIGSGKANYNTALNLVSETIKNTASNRIYDYTVSYDLKIDDWTRLDANGNEIDHSSRYVNILHGSSGTATIQMGGGILYVCVSDGSNVGVGEDGIRQPLVTMWDTTTGVGDWHNIRLSYSKGTDGAGYVDVYVDGVCKIDHGKYANKAVALPVNGELNAGRYFGVRAEDREEPYGALRSKIRFDNIKLEYVGAPNSKTEPYGDGVLRVMNGKINTKESLNGKTITFNHVYEYTVENNGAAETMNAILATYDDAGILTSCVGSKTAIPAYTVKEGSVTLTSTADISGDAGYTLKGYVWTENGKARYDVLGFERNEIDWALMELDSLFDKEKQLNWLSSLFDTKTGGMYYSASAMLNPADYVQYDSSLEDVSFGAHIESTYGGMYSIIPYLSGDIKAAMASWLKSCYDANSGYFVEPEFKNQVLGDLASYNGKTGRDLGYARGLLWKAGYMNDNYEFIEPAQTSEVSLMAVSDNIDDNLGSWTQWKAYLDSRDWSESGVWETCHNMESKSGQIIAAGYKKQTAEYIANLIHPETGMLCGKKQFSFSSFKNEWVVDKVVSYDTMSGTLKAMWAFGADSIPYPYIDALFNNALGLTQTSEPSELAQVINLPVGLQGAMNSYAAAGSELPASVKATLEGILPDLIRTLTKQLAVYLKPDGCFGYAKLGGQQTAQGTRVSMGQLKDSSGRYLFDESDVNGNGLATRARSVLYEFAGRVATTIVKPQELAARINAIWADANCTSAQEKQGFIIADGVAVSESVWTLTKSKR